MRREMKLCSIKWFDKIPSEWKVVKVKQLFSIGRGRVIAQTELNDNGIYPVYSSQTKNNGCLGYINTYDFDKKQLTWTTDGANAGTVFLREGKYNCTNVCGTLLPKSKENNLVYLKYILEYTSIFHKRADTNGFKIMNNEMAEIPILLPNKIEQDEIANYLNKKVSQIDDIISKQKSLIKKYKAYKQSLITEVVTKGLNKNIPMKNSGIEWIGEIPYHWKIKKMKYVTDIIMGQSPDSDDIRDSGSILFMQGNTEFGKKYPKPTIYCDSCNKLSRCGDILMSVRAPVGALNFSDKAYGIGRGLCSIGIKSNLDINYLWYYLQKSKEDFRYYSNGSTFEAITINILNNFYIVIPELSEQKLIVDFIEKKCSAINSVIYKKEQLVEKLESYKKSLIYECVTGKREVN